ncbi:uncharacterized protein LOC143237465 [Tachypleus tridentatus]|uniref:uncharacterized protein LOC143237465 n=1 Tax=Tachypleus tridentatus TaxID=6853 RepID=UPI003FCF15B1
MMKTGKKHIDWIAVTVEERGVWKKNILNFYGGNFCLMGRANMYAQYRAGRTTSPATPIFGKQESSSDTNPLIRPSINPSGFLQNFGNPFHCKQKPKHNPQQSHSSFFSKYEKTGIYRTG